MTCNQGAEHIAPCTRKSLVYENVCGRCNEGAKGKKELEDVDPTIPSIYVGESSHTIQERSREHWAASKGCAKVQEGSHIYKHQELHDNGAEPNFIMRVMEYHKTALSRQTAEAVRIQRRGGAGAVLNSKNEYNRCFIPRLWLIEEEVVEEMERAEEQELRHHGATGGAGQ